MTPDELDDLEKFENQNSDMDSPLAPAHVSDDIADDHPATDTGLDDEELYEEGISGASEAQEPAAGNDIVDYTDPDEPAED